MTTDDRVFLCRLLEKIKEQETYCERIGVRDRSIFLGKATLQVKMNDFKNSRKEGR